MMSNPSEFDQIKLMALFDKEAKGMVPLLNKSISC